VKIMIESTDKLTTIDGTPVRLWHGCTESGTRCLVFVRRLAVPTTEPMEEFERELEETLPPGEIVSLRQIL
jgi:hypothetical protein